jgi:hypothetical protein
MLEKYDGIDEFDDQEQINYNANNQKNLSRECKNLSVYKANAFG